MSAPPDLDAEAERWLREAADDLHAANILYADPDSPKRLACFLSHLAAEKALKATLASFGVAFRKMHDLRSLKALLPGEAQGGFEDSDLRALAPWAIAGRYPDELPEADERAAVQALDAAARVLEHARESTSGRIDNR